MTTASSLSSNNIEGATVTETRRVAYQGTSGAYSHLACRRVFPDWEAVACDDFQSALDRIQFCKPRSARRILQELFP